MLNLGVIFLPPLAREGGAVLPEVDFRSRSDQFQAQFRPHGARAQRRADGTRFERGGERFRNSEL